MNASIQHPGAGGITAGSGEAETPRGLRSVSNMIGSLFGDKGTSICTVLISIAVLGLGGLLTAGGLSVIEMWKHQAIAIETESA